MNEEFLVEEAVVLSLQNGFAEVSVLPNNACDDCSAKIICSPDNNNRNLLRVDNSLGAKVGDNVKIQIKGKSILFESFNLYGIPLIILIIGILLGMFLFAGYRLIELYSVLFGIGLISLYYFFLFTYNKSRKIQILPKIVFIKRNN